MSFSIRRSLAWMGMAQVISFLILFAGSVVLARLLTPREMGVYAAASAFLGILATLRTFGLPNIIVREPQLSPELIATTFTINAALCLFSSILVLGSSQFIGQIYSDSNISRLLVVLAVAPIIGIFDFLPTACLEHGGEFQRISTVNIMKVLIGTTVTVSLAAMGYSFMSLALGSVFSSVFGAITISIIGRQHVSFRLGISEWRKVGKFGVQLMTLNLLSAVMQRLYDLVLGLILGLTALGLWSRAGGLNSMLWDNIHSVVARIAFVEFAERGRRGLSLQETYLRMVAILTVVLWPAFMGIAILAGPIVYTVYGPNWIKAAIPLTWMSIGGAIVSSVTMTWEVYVAKNEMAAQIRYQLKRTIISATLFVAGCYGGINWAAASRTADAVMTVLLVKHDIQRMTSTIGSDYWPIYMQSAYATAAACFPAIVLMQAYRWSVDTPFGAVLAAVAAGVALWFLALRLSKHPMLDEITIALSRITLILHTRRKEAQAP